MDLYLLTPPFCGQSRGESLQQLLKKALSSFEINFQNEIHQTQAIFINSHYVFYIGLDLPHVPPSTVTTVGTTVNAQVSTSDPPAATSSQLLIADEVSAPTEGITTQDKAVAQTVTTTPISGTSGSTTTAKTTTTTYSPSPATTPGSIPGSVFPERRVS